MVEAWFLEQVRQADREAVVFALIAPATAGFPRTVIQRISTVPTVARDALVLDAQVWQVEQWDTAGNADRLAARVRSLRDHLSCRTDGRYTSTETGGPSDDVEAPADGRQAGEARIVTRTEFTIVFGHEAAGV